LKQTADAERTNRSMRSTAPQTGEEPLAFPEIPFENATTQAGRRLCKPRGRFRYLNDLHYLLLNVQHNPGAEAKVVLHVVDGVGHLGAYPIRFQRAQRETVFQRIVHAPA
jgi:hypothetical protein